MEINLSKYLPDSSFSILLDLSELKDIWFYLLKEYKPGNAYSSDGNFNYKKQYLNNDRCFILVDKSINTNGTIEYFFYLRNLSEKENYDDWDKFPTIDFKLIKRNELIKQLI